MGILSADRDGSWTTWFLVTTGPHPMGQVIEMAQLAMERWEVREELGAPAPAACSLPAHPCIHPCVAFLAVSTFSIIILNRSPATESTTAESTVQWVTVCSRGGHHSLIPRPFVILIRRPCPRQRGLTCVTPSLPAFPFSVLRMAL